MAPPDLPAAPILRYLSLLDGQTAILPAVAKSNFQPETSSMAGRAGQSPLTFANEARAPGVFLR